MPQSSALAKIIPLPTRNRDEREFLPAAIEIIETPASPVGRMIGLSIIAMTVMALLWACLGHVDIIATATGRIVPQGKIKIVQPLETGTVAAIHVADGDHVITGQALIALDSVQAQADRDRYARDLRQARLNLARLRGLAAQLTGQAPAPGTATLIDPPADATAAELALAQTALQAQVANQAAKLADIEQQIAEKEAEAAEAQAAVEKLQAALPMVQGQEAIRRDLRDKEYGNKLAWFQANQQLIEEIHEIPVETRRQQAVKAAGLALRQQLAATAAEYQISVLQDLDKVEAQVSELQAEFTKADQRLERAVLRAPISGTVQQLAIHTIGGVVTPAEQLLAIVPDQYGLVVEAIVQNKDIGFVHAGQTARVKIDTFNFTRYGLIDGQVLDVTRDAVTSGSEKKAAKPETAEEGDGMGLDASNAPVFMAHIALSSDTIATEAGLTRLSSGMHVSAEIQTGRRRVIEYLLSPLMHKAAESMHER